MVPVSTRSANAGPAPAHGDVVVDRRHLHGVRDHDVDSFDARPARVCVLALPLFLEKLTAWHAVVVSRITDRDPIRSLGGGGIRV